MAKIQSSRAKVYETKARVGEEATEHVESEGERLVKNMVQKQLNTCISLQQQLSRSDRFQPPAPLVPVTTLTSGQASLQQFEACSQRARDEEELRACGLTAQEVALLQAGEDKRRRVEGSVLESRLARIRDRVRAREQQLHAEHPPRRQAVSRHEQELSLSVKPGSQHTRLLQFALACNPGQPLDQRPATHPIHRLPDLEHQLFGHLVSPLDNPGRRKPLANFSPKTFVPSSEIIAPSSDLPPASSLWDVKVPTQTGSKEKRVAGGDRAVYACKPQTLYTVRNGEIVPVTSKPTEPPKLKEKSGHCGGTAFVVTAAGDPEMQPLSLEAIGKNRLSVEQIRQLPRFHNYDKGFVSQTLFVKNLAGSVKEADLVRVFGSLEEPGQMRIVYRLLTGPMKGQAFLTFPSPEKASFALEAVNGYLLKERPIIIQFGRSKPKT